MSDPTPTEEIVEVGSGARPSAARRLLAWITQGEMDHAWLGWFAILGVAASDSGFDVLCWSIAALFLMHQFAALRRRNRILSTRISLGRWLRRFDDAYFDAVQRALGSLSPEERARFDQAIGAIRRSSDVDSGGEREGFTPPEEGSPEHAD